MPENMFDYEVYRDLNEYADDLFDLYMGDII